MKKNINGAFFGRQTPTEYAIKKEQAREEAFRASEKSFYMSEFAEYFFKLGKKYGLLKEFRESGII